MEFPKTYVMLPNTMYVLMTSLSISFWILTTLTPRCVWIILSTGVIVDIVKRNKTVFCDRRTCTSNNACAHSSRSIRTPFFTTSLRSNERFTLSLRPSFVRDISSTSTYYTNLLVPLTCLKKCRVPRTTTTPFTVEIVCCPGQKLDEENCTWEL